MVNRDDVAAHLGFAVRRLGNPVAWVDGQGRIHLFVVATGLGGWAAARVVHLRQREPSSALDIKAFEVLRPLPLSWLWNTSFLVRAAPMALQDGGMVLPVHFELGIKYPVALRFDAQGDFQGMVRMSRRTYVLQPTLMPLTDVHWLALMRDQRPNGKVTAVETRDSGHSWADLPDLPLDNPDASIAGLATAPGQMVLAGHWFSAWPMGRPRPNFLTLLSPGPTGTAGSATPTGASALLGSALPCRQPHLNVIDVHEF